VVVVVVVVVVGKVVVRSFVGLAVRLAVISVTCNGGKLDIEKGICITRK
jgi:hypothetical protein